jgi:succinate dehydrogenase/fumarate reductase-like Fe-S protein
MTDRITISVKRGLPSEDGRIETFTVPYSEGMSVLDALLWIQSNEDSSLAVRYSCINANACKECSVQIDGEVRYACTARLTDGSLVEPLANKPLIRDLVTEIAPAKEVLAKALAR